MKNRKTVAPDLIHVAERGVRKWGIYLDGLLYDCDDLQEARRRNGRDLRVQVYLDPRTVASLLAASRTGRS